MKNTKIKNHTVGQTRYFTYYLIFPKDKDFWVDQIPFAQPLDNFLKNTNLGKARPDLARALMQDGEFSYKDNNGVTHRIVIKEEEIPRKWGANKPTWTKNYGL